MISHTNRNFVGVFFLALFFSIGIFVYALSGDRTSGNDMESLDGEYWKKRIESNGARDAYEEMVKHAADMHTIDAHVMAHAFGRALYEAKGEDAFGVCDFRVEYGCIHEFFAMALSENGFDSLDAILEKCSEDAARTSACRHSVGHGLIGVLGYTADDLEEALAMCKEKNFTSFSGGCYGGAFMEFNLRTLTGDSKHFFRKFAGDAFSPCNELSDAFTSSCIFRLPEWWGYALFSSTIEDSTFERMGLLCRELDTPSAVHACIAGVGKVAGQTFYTNPERIASSCLFASKDEEENLVCRIFALKRAAEILPNDRLIDVCEGFKGAEYVSCTAFLDTQFKDKCETLPVSVREFCTSI